MLLENIYIWSAPWVVQRREKSWFASSLNSRSQFLAPHPGLPRILEEPREGVDLDPSKGPVSAFCLLEFDPEQVWWSVDFALGSTSGRLLLCIYSRWINTLNFIHFLSGWLLKSEKQWEGDVYIRTSWRWREALDAPESQPLKENHKVN